MNLRSLAVLLLAACSGGPKPSTTVPAPVGDTTAPTPAPAPPVAPPPAPAPPRVNPLFAMSPLYEHAPPFDQFREDDYMPAYLEAMKQHAAEIRAIADSPDEPTFENTIVAMERTGAMLQRVQYVFGNLAAALTDDKMQKIEADVAPLMAKHQDDIHLDAKLFARVHALYGKRKALKLDAVDQRLLERYHLDFVRAGAQLNAADQTALRAMNEEVSTLQTKYSELQIKDMNASAVIVDDVKELDGMSESDIAAAAAAATTRGKQGHWMI